MENPRGRPASGDIYRLRYGTFAQLGRELQGLSEDPENVTRRRALHDALASQLSSALLGGEHSKFENGMRLALDYNQNVLPPDLSKLKTP